MEVDVSKDMVKDNTILGISLLNNFQFTDESGIHVWQGTRMGPKECEEAVKNDR